MSDTLNYWQPTDPQRQQLRRTGETPNQGTDARTRYTMPNWNAIGPEGRRMGNFDEMGHGIVDENLVSMFVTSGLSAVGADDYIHGIYGSRQLQSTLRQNFEPEDGYNPFADQQVLDRPDRFQVAYEIEGSRSSRETASILERLDNPYDERNSYRNSAWYMAGRIAGGFADVTSFVPFAWAKGAGRGALALGGLLTAEELAKQAIDPARDDLDLMYVAAFGAAFGGMIGRMNYRRSLPGRINQTEQAYSGVRESPTYRMNERILSNSGTRQLNEWMERAPSAARRILEDKDFGTMEWTGIQHGILRRLIDNNNGQLPFGSAREAFEQVRIIQLGGEAAAKLNQTMVHILRKKGVDADWVAEFRRVLSESPEAAQEMLEEVLPQGSKMYAKLRENIYEGMARRGDSTKEAIRSAFREFKSATGKAHKNLNDYLRKEVAKAEAAEAKAMRASDPDLAKMAEDASAKHADLLRSTGKGRLEALADEYPHGASIGSKEMQDWFKAVDDVLDDIESGRNGNNTSGLERQFDDVMDDAGRAQRNEWMDEANPEAKLGKVQKVLNEINEQLIDMYVKMGLFDPGPGIVAGPGAREAFFNQRLKSAMDKGVKISGGTGGHRINSDVHHARTTQEILKKLPNHMPVDPVPAAFRTRILKGARAMKAMGLENLIDSPVKSILQKSQSAYAKQLVEWLTEVNFWQAKNFDEAVDGFTRTDNAAQLVEELNARSDLLLRDMRTDYEEFLESTGQFNPGQIRRIMTHDVPVLGKNVVDDMTHPAADKITEAQNWAKGQGEQIRTWEKFNRDVTYFRATRARAEVTGDTHAMRRLDDYLDSQPGGYADAVRKSVDRTDAFYQKWADDLHESGQMYQARIRFMHRRFAEHSDMKFYREFNAGMIKRYIDELGEEQLAPKGGWPPAQLRELADRAILSRWRQRGSMSEEEIAEAFGRLRRLWDEHEEFLANPKNTRSKTVYKGADDPEWRARWNQLIERWVKDEDVGEYANAVGKSPTYDQLMRAVNFLENFDEGKGLGSHPNLYRFWEEVLELQAELVPEMKTTRTLARSPWEKMSANLFESAQKQSSILRRLQEDYASGQTKARAKNHIYRVWNTRHIAKNIGDFRDKLMTLAKIEDEFTGEFRDPTFAEATAFAKRAEHTGAMGRQNNADDGWALDPRKWLQPEKLHEGTSVATTVQMRRWRLHETDFEEYLEFNQSRLNTVYNRNTAPDQVLSMLFRRADLEPQLAVIRQEYLAAVRAGEMDMVTAMKNFSRDKKNILSIRDQIRGTYGLPSNPNGLLSRSLRAMKHYNMLTQLTGFIAATGDAAFAVMRLGLSGGLRPAFRALTNRQEWTAHLKASKANLQLYGEAMDLYASQRHAKLMNLDQNLGIPMGMEGGLAKLSDINFRWINMMDQWNTWAKITTSAVMETKHLDLLEKYFGNGRSTKGMSRMEKAYLRRNFDIENADLMDEMEEMVMNYTQRGKGIKTIDGMAATQYYPAAHAAYGRALAREVRSAIVTPMAGGSPNFMMTEWGSVLFQYWRFVSETHNRVLLSGLQAKDRAFVEGLALAVGIGIGIEMFRRGQLGMQPMEDPREFMLAGIERSGVGGYLVQGNGILERLSDNNLGLSSMLGVAPPYGTSTRTKVGAATGPTGATIANWVDAAYDVGADRISHNRAREATARQIGNMLPFGNVAWANRVFSHVDDGIEAGLGALTRARNSGASMRYATPVPEEEEVLPISPADESRVE